MTTRRRLRPGEARSLLALLGFALASREPAAAIEETARDWGSSRLAAAARQAARALAEGTSVAGALAGRLPDGALAALAAGERSGDPARGTDRAAELLERHGAGRSGLLSASSPPFAGAIVAVALAAIVTAGAAPSIHALRSELAAAGDAGSPSVTLRLAASHPGAVAGLGLACALLIALTGPVTATLVRTRRGSAALLRLPLLGSLLRERAAADYAASLSDLLAAGLPFHLAHAAAASVIGAASLRRSAGDATARLEDGEPPHVALAAAGFPAHARATLQSEAARSDGGVAAARRVAVVASDRQAALTTRLRTVAAVAGHALTAVALLFALLAVIVPLATIGGAP